MSELLPCPFCGAEPRYFDTQDFVTAPGIICDACNIEVLSQHAKRNAALMWNTRPSLPVSEPGVRDRIYNVALAELEKKRLMPTSVTLATAIANAAAAAFTSPSNGEAQP